MNRMWLITVLISSFCFLALLESKRLSTLQPYFKAERTIKLKRFEVMKRTLPEKDQELLELWESMLTGRVAPVSAWMKNRYRMLGLSHLFTPLLFIPGQGPLKRMVFIKGHQKVLGLHIGFIVAIILDSLFGTFQGSPLSFTYSCLFLGIIYSGAEGVGLIFWFFIAQILLAHFQGVQISPLLLIFSPILNFGFGLAMPVLFILAFPLWNWQLHMGLYILRFLQFLVDFFAGIILHFPTWEINIAMLILVFFFLTQRWRLLMCMTLLFCNSLNLDFEKTPGFSKYEFAPQGNTERIVLKDKYDLIYFRDGKCKRKLIRGFWWEKCSPNRRSTRKKILTKLSSLSSNV
jgi:hypothetical protein